MSGDVDLRSLIITDVALPVFAYTATGVEGNIIDLTGSYGLTFIANSSGLTAPGSVTFTIEHSDTLNESDFETVDPEFLIGDLTLTEESPGFETSSIGYVGKKQYVRCTKNEGTTDASFGVISLKYSQRRVPFTDPPVISSSVDFLLTENGAFLSLENGGKIII